MENSDIYKTIVKSSPETLFKEKGSKFFGYAFPVKNEEDITANLEKLRQAHRNARHFCYAYQLGTENISYRANDDGEPSGTAGMPIYGQIQSFEVTNILIVVVRYFGGTKLGTGGLISAYKQSAKLTMEACIITEKTIDKKFTLSFDYKDMNKVMRVIREKDITIENQQLEINCSLLISVRKNKADEILRAFEALYEVSVREVS